jgi:hypothetical protein
MGERTGNRVWELEGAPTGAQGSVLSRNRGTPPSHEPFSIKDTIGMAMACTISECSIPRGRKANAGWSGQCRYGIVRPTRFCIGGQDSASRLILESYKNKNNINRFSNVIYFYIIFIRRKKA